MTKTITTIFAVSLLVAILIGSMVLSQTAFAGVISESQKTTICHVEQKTGIEETKTVGKTSVVTHLKNHGDYLGACSLEPFTCMECQEKFSETLNFCDSLKPKSKSKCIDAAATNLIECNSLCTPEAGETFEIFDSSELLGIFSPAISSVDDPSNHLVSSGGKLDGVGIFLQPTSIPGTFDLCSSALLADGIHVLTAAHCVTDKAGTKNFVSGTVTFSGDLATYQHNVIKADVHPGWTGSITSDDVAILTLDTRVSPDIERYDIDTLGSDDVGSTVQHVGFGQKGTGAGGEIQGSAGTKREGSNKYDSLGDTIWSKFSDPFSKESQLHFDFDNGLAANDAFGLIFGLNDLGLANNKEVLTAGGDSGGPAFNSNHEISGIHSWRAFILDKVVLTSSDIDSDFANSSFGEFGGDTRVSKYTNFIESYFEPPVGGGVSADLDIVDAGTEVVYTWGAGQATGSGTPATCTITDNVYGDIANGFMISSPNSLFSQTHTINQETTNTATLTCTDQWGHTWVQQSSQTVEIAPDLATCQAACVAEETACDQSGAQPSSSFTCAELGFFCDEVCTNRGQETCENWCILRGHLCVDLGNDQMQCDEEINSCISACSPVQ